MPRHYDYGLRGYRDTARPRYGDYGARPYRAYGYRYDAGFSRYDGPPPPLPNRVTQRYNEEYVRGHRGERYPINLNPYGGDRADRIGDAGFYRRPYMTTGGSNTLRGSEFPARYDYRDFGPTYGGRYPDEL